MCRLPDDDPTGIETCNSLELFHQPTLMHNFPYSLTLNLLTTTIVAPPSNASKWQMGFNSAFKGLIICLLHYYPRHVSSINMPIFRRKNCIHTASGIFALCKRLHNTLVESSQPVYEYYADVFGDPSYQMLCEYEFSS